MPKKSKKVLVGEVVKSSLFQYGEFFDYRDHVTVGHCYDETKFDEKTQQEVKTGRKVSSGNSDDASRADAEYVVIRAVMEGGGTGHGPHDVYPDGWHIHARRLDSDGKYNPEGEEIRFYQSGAFTCMVPEVEVVRTMQMTFVQKALS